MDIGYIRRAQVDFEWTQAHLIYLLYRFNFAIFCAKGTICYSLPKLLMRRTKHLYFQVLNAIFANSDFQYILNRQGFTLQKYKL